ncbi:universal stress protein [Corynebacterium sp.]|uniref:universal stress protein n=1 Tax=Corynebacterium sp. TaxID=1720 RepID=UPI0026DD2F8F|nr:universal stress protein [Corynebacterium sp.]MDO4610251.1 universal stress protein [Corynebacterium sp.]
MTDSMLIAYDGSAEARLAIKAADRFMRVETAYILTAWEPVGRQAARTAGTSGMPQPEWSHAGGDDPAQAEAERISREGVALAKEAGFDAEPYLVETESSIWSAIIDAALELDVDVIVSGTRGSSGLRGLLSTSTAEAVMKKSGKPVLIVPPEK